MTRRTAAIIGGGVIGGGWAARFLLHGWDVVLHDPAPDAQAKVEAVVANARYALPMLYEHSLPPEGTLKTTTTIAQAVRYADWVQESVPERLDLKRDTLSEILQHVALGIPIGSSTSGFTPTELFNDMATPDRLFVAHPFNPVYLLPLVELVPDKTVPQPFIDQTSAILTGLGLIPLHIRQEISAHVADRLLEAVWREALWLVHDDVATTQEIDDAIRFGFGLRWAQMGLFETYRLAGGEAGMKHFISQFGPALKWPWTKLTDVPELTDELICKIADQSDAQSGQHSFSELERMRDENLVGILRSLKARNGGAGAHLVRQDADLGPAPATGVGTKDITTISRSVPIDWTDYNGHMNESRYGQVFSDAADEIMRRIGADAAYISGGDSYFTVDIHIRFLAETKAAQHFSVQTRVVEAHGKKLRLYHEMQADDGSVLATAEQLLIHVNLKTRKSSEPRTHVAAKAAELATAHASLPRPKRRH